MKQGRGDRLIINEGIFSGLIWSGEKALSLGLIDGFATTKSLARDLKAENVVDFTPESDLLQRISDRIGSSAGQQLSEQFSNRYSIK